jgi:hypothetical protein
MVTSRPHITIDRVISNFEALEIRATEIDIRKYLEGQILQSPRLSKQIENSAGLREVIEAEIVQRSDGMCDSLSTVEIQLTN